MIPEKIHSLIKENIKAELIIPVREKKEENSGKI